MRIRLKEFVLSDELKGTDLLCLPSWIMEREGLNIGHKVLLSSSSPRNSTEILLTIGWLPFPSPERTTSILIGKEAFKRVVGIFQTEEVLLDYFPLPSLRTPEAMAIAAILLQGEGDGEARGREVSRLEAVLEFMRDNQVLSSHLSYRLPTGGVFVLIGSRAWGRVDPIPDHLGKRFLWVQDWDNWEEHFRCFQEATIRADRMERELEDLLNRCRKAESEAALKRGGVADALRVLGRLLEIRDHIQGLQARKDAMIRIGKSIAGQRGFLADLRKRGAGAIPSGRPSRLKNRDTGETLQGQDFLDACAGIIEEVRKCYGVPESPEGFYLDIGSRGDRAPIKALNKRLDAVRLEPFSGRCVERLESNGPIERQGEDLLGYCKAIEDERRSREDRLAQVQANLGDLDEISEGAASLRRELEKEIQVVVSFLEDLLEMLARQETGGETFPWGGFAEALALQGQSFKQAHHDLNPPGARRACDRLCFFVDRLTKAQERAASIIVRYEILEDLPDRQTAQIW